MKRLFLYAVLGAMALGTVPMAEARHDRDVIRVKTKYRGDRDDWRRGYRDHHRTRTIYVVENRRPVRRVVYVDDNGGYYHYAGGRRSYVRGRYFTSYPSRYFYSDGRPRVGVSINF
jgi:hypothetical protein